MFYEAFVHLEVLLAKYVPVEDQMETGMTRCLTRFLLEQSCRSSSKGNSLPRSSLPIDVQRAILQFYRTFIIAGSPYEVNISHAIRQNVVDSLPETFTASKPSEHEASLSAGPECSIPVHIFDEAADEILDLLFRNTFHLFVAQQYEPSAHGF